MAIAVQCALSISQTTSFVKAHSLSNKGIQRVQIGFNSFQGIRLNNHVKTKDIRQSSRKSQVGVGLSGFCVKATAATTPSVPPLTIPKQKIRIKLKSYWIKPIEDAAKLILDAARSTNATTMGPVPLPTKRRVYCVLTSPHVHKDAREHFEKRTHQRLIDVENPSASTIDALMTLNIPPGVHVEVKLK
ncbi:hypothetical protein SUGI_0294740 [Cryptomeria japonica]|uniref:small ribosomal subunit protein uS10c n=1 Tax=Cryptomeria japonica TaxID=3369 RepID=UPI002408E2CF|nr:small ribosomal subunit protein uS10c [Cryptomeria japonica]GLJ17036.1 hypothetical protein SUGI_0294740 [Cryptomeria japonica]